MSDMCNDNRFELIEKYKKELIESTNIETRPDEMAVLDDILFRFWQMGWLEFDYGRDLQIAYDEGYRKGRYDEKVYLADCISRAEAIRIASGYCHPANIADELRKLPPAQPEWISVKDRLPEEGVSCIACGKRGGLYVARLRKEGKDPNRRYKNWQMPDMRGENE